MIFNPAKFVLNNKIKIALIFLFQLLCGHYVSLAQTVKLTREISSIETLIQHDTIIIGKRINISTQLIHNKYNNANRPVSLKDSLILSRQSNQKVLSLIVDIFTTNTTCESKNGSIIVIAGNGTPPYIYTIDNNLPYNTGNFVNFFAGDHKIYVEDALGVKDSATVNLTNTYPAISFFNSINLSAVWGCSSKIGTFTLSPIGGTPPFTYSNDRINYQSSPNFSNLYSGIYYPDVKDANGCQAITSEWILPDACNYGYSASGSSSSCGNNGSINFEADGNTPPYFYSLDSIHYQATGEFYGLSPGIYNIYTKDANDISSVFAISVFDYCYLTSVATVTSPTCGNNIGSITLSSSQGVAPYTYSMDGLNFQSSNVFSGLSVGYYAITTKDASGQLCYVTAHIDSGCPIITAVAFAKLCDGTMGSIRALANNGTAPYSYSINGVLFQTSNQFDGLAAGSYTVTAKDANGFKDSTIVTVLDGNCFTVTATIVNAFCNADNGSITVNSSNGTPPYFYSLDGVNYQANNIFSALAAGAYKVYAKDGTNTITSIPVTIIDRPAPQINTTAMPAGCAANSGTVIITVVGGTAPFQYSIDSINFQAGNQFNNLAAGLITAWVKDSNGCKAIDTITVSSLPLPVVSLGNDTSLCIGDSLLLTTNLFPQYTYVWQNGSSSNDYLAHSAGVYIIKVTNEFNCSLSDTITIVSSPLPAFTLGNDTSICTGKNLYLQAQLPNATYLWSTGNNTSAISVSSAGLYWLTINQSGCHKTDSINVSLKSLPVINLGMDTSLCEGNTLQLTLSNNNTNYIWQDNSTANFYLISKEGMYYANAVKDGCSAGDTIIISYILKPRFTLGPTRLICQGEQVVLQPDVDPRWNLVWQDGSTKSFYKVTQQGTYYLDANNNCGTTREEILFTKGLCHIYIPNAFTPNADSKNEIFKISGTELITSFHLQIFNRYGHLVFETGDKNKGWDGTIKNQPAEYGNYIYLLRYKESTDNEMQVLRGSCLLLR